VSHFSGIFSVRLAFTQRSETIQMYSCRRQRRVLPEDAPCALPTWFPVSGSQGVAKGILSSRKNSQRLSHCQRHVLRAERDGCKVRLRET